MVDLEGAYPNGLGTLGKECSDVSGQSRHAGFRRHRDSVLRAGPLVAQTGLTRTIVGIGANLRMSSLVSINSE